MSETRGRPMDVSRSEAEKFALRRINECAPDFALNHPQIVEDLRIMTLEDVAKKYNVEELFSVTLQIAKGIVNRAIRIILTPEEIKELYGPRLIKLHREVGLNSFANGTGLFGITAEERKAASIKAGRGGSVTLERGVGLFGMDREARVAASKKAHAVRGDGWFDGKIVDEMNEGTYAKHLASLSEYQISSGQFKGSPDYTKIMNAVNLLYGKNRSRSATKGFFENEKVRAKNKDTVEK